MLRRIVDQARSVRREMQLPAAARRERENDKRGVLPPDPGLDRVIAESLRWIACAQDNSRSGDGGVARDYSLIDGWATSYPETTGYIVPTLIECGQRFGDARLLDRARRMLDWLASIQLPDGGFQGGRIDSRPVVPVTFNTGQILLGLAAGTKAFGVYREPMLRAANWLVRTQDADGCWRQHPSPFARAGEKAYDTHVAWGLFEAARVEPGFAFDTAALANVRWALGRQRSNGWLADCCLSDPSRPLTHTLGYALRGILEAYRYCGDAILLEAATRTADKLLTALRSNGHLPGQFTSDWAPAASWACLTGAVQIAHCWLLLHRHTGEDRYRDAGFKANEFVRRTVRIDGPPEQRGGVKGSYPVDGDYGRYQYLNWAAKFLIDSLLVEREIRSASLSVERAETGFADAQSR